jgi:hypothetical protein
MSLRSKRILSVMAMQAGAAALAAMLEIGGKCIRHDVPGANTRLLVYSDINARWCCWWLEGGSDTLLRAKIKGL